MGSGPPGGYNSGTTKLRREGTFPQRHTWVETMFRKPRGNSHQLEALTGQARTGPQEGLSCPGPVSCSCCNKRPQTRGHNNRNSSSHILEARSPRSGHCRAMLPPEAPREGPSLAPVAAGGPRHPWLVAASLPLSSHGFCLLCVFPSSISNLPLLPLTRTPVIGLRAHPGDPG